MDDKKGLAMSAKIDSINLNESDGLIIKCNDSSEKCIAVYVENDKIIIQGPMNINRQTIIISYSGVVVIKDR